MKKIQTCTNIDSNKLISGRIVKTHIATFILHSTSHFLFHYVTNSTVLCCKSVTLNNNNKKKCVCGGGGGGGGGRGGEGGGERNSYT